MQTVNTTSTPAPAFLGLDAGGTQTRWAVADASLAVQRRGQVAGISALQLLCDSGRVAVAAVLAEVAVATGPVQAVVAGLTGFDATQLPLLRGLLAKTFGVDAGSVQAMSDIELACHAAFKPGEGYVVVAGTGSIAAFIDSHGALHRAGGRGAVIDDAGGGHWIARQALRHIWRADDEAPGAWQHSALARQLFERLGGSEWQHTRQWVYGADASRGELGTLALAVAAAAAEDPAALAILQAAGTELARLARALLQRHGTRPLALAGRVFDLHPTIRAHLQQALPPGTSIQRLMQAAEVEAARMAAQMSSMTAAHLSTTSAVSTSSSPATRSAVRIAPGKTAP